MKKAENIPDTAFWSFKQLLLCLQQSHPGFVEEDYGNSGFEGHSLNYLMSSHHSLLFPCSSKSAWL